MEETNLNINQDNQEIKWGGKIQNAGRPVGSGTKPKLSDDLTDKQKELLVAKAYSQALEGDAKLLQFILEQIYGKANQAVELDGGAKFVLEIAKQVADKNENYVSSSNAGNSSGR
jgi:hypothetical protein